MVLGDDECVIIIGGQNGSLSLSLPLFLNAVKRQVLAVKRVRVTMLLLAPFASKEILILWEEVVRKTVNVLVTLLTARLLLRRRTAHHVMKTRTHALMEHVQVSRDITEIWIKAPCIEDPIG